MIFILNWLRGIILGWILSLIFLLIKRMLRRAFNMDAQKQQHHEPQYPEQKAQQHQPSPTKDETYKPYSSNQVIDTIWVGMRDVDLINNFGSPNARKSNISAGEEIWTYNNMPHMRGITKITIKNDKISGWVNE